MTASGVATITRSASRPASATSAILDAPSRSAAARVDGAAELRPATATAVQPRATSAAATVVPARPGPTRASARCDRLCTCTSAFPCPFVPAPVRVPVYSGGANRRPVGRTDAASAGILVRQPGSRSARGTTTNARSVIRGCGHDEIGLVDPFIAHEQHVDVDRPGAPADGADPLAVCLDRTRELEQRARGAVGVDRHDRVQIVGLCRTTDGRGLVHRRHGRDIDTVGCGEIVDRLLQVLHPVTEVRSDPQVGAARRATSGHCSMHTATWSTMARTGGCSLRTVTLTPVTRSSTRHTSAIRVARRSSR